MSDMNIDAGEGMRSVDIPDGFSHLPDRGTCPVCRDKGIRLKKNGALWQHWKRGWSRRAGHPPCSGTDRQPAILNESRVIRHLATKAGRYWLSDQEEARTDPMSMTAEK